jgi:hypothetical protein
MNKAGWTQSNQDDALRLGFGYTVTNMTFTSEAKKSTISATTTRSNCSKPLRETLAIPTEVSMPIDLESVQFDGRTLTHGLILFLLSSRRPNLRWRDKGWSSKRFGDLVKRFHFVQSLDLGVAVEASPRLGALWVTGSCGQKVSPSPMLSNQSSEIPVSGCSCNQQRILLILER